MENKRKTIIPIVIAVTLLIVLIVGAAFAYFQATNSASGTTNLEATTETLGAVIVTNPTENLSMKLTAYDMQESNAGTTYYATSDTTKGYETVGQNHVISTATISGGEEDTVYNCTYKLTVTKPNDIRSGDMALFINGNGATLNGTSSVNTDLYGASSGNIIVYNVSFSHKGNGTINLLTADVAFNNTNSIQDHLIGKTLTTTITNSELNCDVGESTVASICTYDSTSTVAEGLEGAKYNCKVDPNKPEYTFYILDNNEDGTSDLIMNANINSDGESVIPGVTSDTGMVAWQSSGSNIDGPVTAMTYLHNATKSWINVEPVNYTYNDREVQGITGTDVGYQSFISTNGIATITKGDSEGTQVTIGSESEPLRVRMPIYSSDASVTEVINMINASYLYDNLDVNEKYSGPFGYWTFSSLASYYGYAMLVSFGGGAIDDDIIIAYNVGVRPVITVTL